MLRLLLIAVCALFATSPALACLRFESQDSVHQREISILGAGLQKSKREASVLAKAKELRDLAEAAFKASNYEDATRFRHSALIAIGYKLKEGPLAEISAGGQIPAKSLPGNGQDVPTRGCGGTGPVWTPPSD